MNEDFTEAVHHQAPDVARSPADDFEPLAVRRETRQLRLVELGHAANLRFDLRVVERALRHQNPAAWRAGELVRKQVRVLNAEPGEHRREFVGASIAVGVFVKTNLAVILNERAVFVRQQAERNHQTFGEGSRFLAARDGRRVEHQQAISTAAGK